MFFGSYIFISDQNVNARSKRIRNLEIAFFFVPSEIPRVARWIISYMFEILVINALRTATFKKSVHFGYVHSWLFAPVNTRVQRKILSLSYHGIVVFE